MATRIQYKTEYQGETITQEPLHFVLKKIDESSSGFIQIDSEWIANDSIGKISAINRS